MDGQTLDSLADMICGGDGYPVYRTGSDLSRFFERSGFSNVAHDGSARKRWTLEILNRFTEIDVKKVILRLGDPREYRGDQQLVEAAHKKLNGILMVEGMKVELEGVRSVLKDITPQFAERDIDPDLKPLPAPDFLNLKLEPGLGEILASRWEEAQKCLNADAYLASIIIMGSMLEGMILAVMREFPKEANQSGAAPLDSKSGKAKYFGEWSLSDMINVAHDLGWIGLDVKKFSHALREFRNLIHPYDNTFANDRLKK